MDLELSGRSLTTRAFGQGQPLIDENIYAYEEDPSAEGEGTAISSLYTRRSGGTPATGIPVSRSRRQSPSTKDIGHHLPPGPRENAWACLHMTAGTIDK
jgi:hypothetical protein